VIEQRVLSGVTERLVSAEDVAEAVRAYHEEMNRQNHARRAQTEADRRALPRIGRAINGIMTTIERRDVPAGDEGAHGRRCLALM
jgi:hypothetical protein